MNIYGGDGFVGRSYCNSVSFPIIKNSKEDYSVQNSNCLYLISTIHNYNVFDDALLDVNTNLVVLMRVLENYKNYIQKTGKTGCFNFISSWFVYGKDSGYGNTSIGISEEDYCDPKGFYSITKRCAEQLLISYCDTFNLNYRILRLANVLGKDDQKVTQRKNATQFIFNQLKENKPVQIYDSGELYRDYIDIRDCVRAIDLVVRNGEYNSIYNIGNGVPHSLKSLIDYVYKKVNSKSIVETIPQKEFHKKVQSSRSFYMNADKLKNLGYSPRYSIYDTIEELLS